MRTHPKIIPNPQAGFTLLELSVVLVIIGLIIGGVLVGQDLVNTAAVRAQITQIQKYNTAARTFQTKYGYLPGDIPTATQFGFVARGTLPGQGDGNGLIESNCGSGTTVNDQYGGGGGEMAIFWVDLSTAGLIPDTITSPVGNGAYPQMTYCYGSPTPTSNPSLAQWMPLAKLGQDNYVHIMPLDGLNYFVVSTITHIGWAYESTALPGLTVQQASDIDTKIDDGLPQTGNVNVCYYNYDIQSWESIYSQGGTAGGNWVSGIDNICNPSTVAVPYATTNCYDNATASVPAGVVGVPTYSLQQNAGRQNCALSFMFQ